MEYRRGTIVFEEGERVEGIFLIDSGRVFLSSTLGYGIELGEGEILNEWYVVDEPIHESVTALRRTRLSGVEPGEVYRRSEELVGRNITRLKSATELLSRKADFEDGMKTFEMFRSEKGWRKAKDYLLSSYFSALDLMWKGEYEKAYEEFVEVRGDDVPRELADEVEIWKVYCLFNIRREKAVEKYRVLERRRESLEDHISFRILERIVVHGESALSPFDELYLKRGLLIPSKTVLYFRGEDFPFAGFIVAGSVREVLHSDEGETMIDFLGPGEVVGEEALFSKRMNFTVYTGEKLQLMMAREWEDLDEFKESTSFRLLVRNLRTTGYLKKLRDGMGPSERLGNLLEEKGPDRLNEMAIKPDEMASFLGVKKEDVEDFLVRRGVGRIGSDGTVVFS